MLLQRELTSLKICVQGSYFKTGYQSTVPVNPTLVYEKAFGENISAGTVFSYAGSKINSYYYGDIKYTALYIGSRLSYHFSLKNNSKIDPYLGAGIGYVFVGASGKYGDFVGAVSGIGYSFWGGCRYYFAKKVSVYAEVGYRSLSVLNVGLSFKMCEFFETMG